MTNRSLGVCGPLRRELELVGKYDLVVINDDVSRATDELVGIINRYANGEES